MQFTISPPIVAQEAQFYHSSKGDTLFGPAITFYRYYFGRVWYPLFGATPPKSAAGQRLAAETNETAHWIIQAALIATLLTLFPLDFANPHLPGAVIGMAVLVVANTYAIGLCRYRRCRCSPNPRQVTS